MRLFHLLLYYFSQSFLFLSFNLICSNSPSHLNTSTDYIHTFATQKFTLKIFISSIQRRMLNEIDNSIFISPSLFLLLTLSFSRLGSMHSYHIEKTPYSLTGLDGVPTILRISNFIFFRIFFILPKKAIVSFLC